MAPADDGAFPVSHDFGWHRGKHLVAPIDEANVGLPVRAVADGTVIYVRKRTEVDTTEHPLYYGAGYTSDAVVVIKHTTDIGLNAQGQPVEVVFYSVYMHLHSVRDTVLLNRPIYRKDEIGQAGHIYGKPNRLHFEICCDDDNLKRLVGRASGVLNTQSNGRSDVVFGEVYFSLPAGTLFYGQHPLASHAQASVQPSTPHATRAEPHPAAPAVQPLPPVYTTADELIVGVCYAGGNGTAGHRGDAVVTTYGSGYQIEGKPLTEGNAEYTLYKTSKDISESYPAAARPTPSAVYELLRFGRVIEPDALEPAGVPHWRQANYPGGIGWVNLNASKVHKFSDADFPAWRGWVLADDDHTPDSHCDSEKIADLVYSEGNARLRPTKANAKSQLSNPTVQKRLARAICKFPSEWDEAGIDKRWKWLKTATDEHPELLTSNDYDESKDHVTALCFPLPELFLAQWCFEPREFIELFRKCGWFSLREVVQMLPRSSRAKGTVSWAQSTARFESGFENRGQRQMPSGLWTAINVGFRKYGLASARLRQAHFFGQVFVETGALRLNVEGGNDRYFRTMYEVITPAEAGEDYDNRTGIAWRLGMVYHTVNHQRVSMTRSEYVAARPGAVQRKADELGNTQAGDGPRFRGRGLIQLTGRNNYASYGLFRGRDYTNDPSPQLLAADAPVSTDVSLKYWVSKEWRGINISRHADTGADDDATEKVTRAVNGGTTHIDLRREFFNYAWGLLHDMPTPADTATLKRQYP